MQRIESLLDELRSREHELPVRFRDPLSADEIAACAREFVSIFGVPLPDDYLALLHVSDGLDAGMADIASGETVIEHNQEVWFDRYVTDERGVFERIACKRPSYIWLGYEGNSAEQIYDLASGEYQQVALGGRQPVFRGTLAGLLRHLIFGNVAGL